MAGEHPLDGTSSAKSGSLTMDAISWRVISLANSLTLSNVNMCIQTEEEMHFQTQHPITAQNNVPSI